MKKKTITIAIDIDDTLRDFRSSIAKYLEIDHPYKLDKFLEVRDEEYYSLDVIMDTKEDVHKYLYEERVFELFGMANRVHPKIIEDLNKFAKIAESYEIIVVLASVQHGRSITATLHWLSKWGCRIKNIKFFNSIQEKIDANYDIYIDDCPEVLSSFCKKNKIKGWKLPRAIKVPYKFNKNVDCNVELDIANGKFNDIYGILQIGEDNKRGNSEWKIINE